MNINAIENSGTQNAKAQTSEQTQDALRRAAVQFEAVLLMQLTSALNGSGSDEDSLFGSDGGSDLAKKMFSEQMATTMSESGGIGLSDIILRQFGLSPQKSSADGAKIGGAKFDNVMSAVKDIKSASVSSKGDNPPVIYKNGKIEPVKDVFTGDGKDAEIVSRFEDSYPADAPKNRWGSPFMPDVDAAPGSAALTNITGIAKSSEKISYQMPVGGRISSEFGNRFHPIDKVNKFHAGMDIAAPKGTPIGSAADGVVVFAGQRKGYGNLVIVQHADGRETRYGHAAKILVSENDKVSAGQPIATVGSTGKSTGPHLHFEVRENGQAVNPSGFLSNVLRK